MDVTKYTAKGTGVSIVNYYLQPRHPSIRSLVSLLKYNLRHTQLEKVNFSQSFRTYFITVPAFRTETAGSHFKAFPYSICRLA